MDLDADPGFLSQLSEMTGWCCIPPEKCRSRGRGSSSEWRVTSGTCSPSATCRPPSMRRRRLPSLHKERSFVVWRSMCGCRAGRSWLCAPGAHISRARKRVRGRCSLTAVIAFGVACLVVYEIGTLKTWSYQREAQSRTWIRWSPSSSLPKLSNETAEVSKALAPGELIGRVDIPRLGPVRRCGGRRRRQDSEQSRGTSSRYAAAVAPAGQCRCGCYIATAYSGGSKQSALTMTYVS